jgi:2C-methyl-D-erythritol 2,4-cyclodiphosphate synthase
MHSPQYRPCALIAHSVRRAQVEYAGGHVKQKMINNLVRLLQTDPGRVNVKARTH